MRRTALLCTLGLLLCAGPLAAQGQAMEEDLRRRADEIARLMRESERLLLELTRVERLVAAQEDIVRRLRELEPPTPPGEAGTEDAEERRRRAEELRAQQADIERQLQEMLRNQQAAGARTVEELQRLLESLPRGQMPSGSGDSREQRQQSAEERERQERRRQEERKQEQPREQRDKKDLFDRQRRDDERRDSDKADRDRLRRIEAWIARLPPEDQERINRGDLSSIPARYRRLVREYTALRAERETAEERAR